MSGSTMIQDACLTKFNLDSFNATAAAAPTTTTNTVSSMSPLPALDRPSPSTEDFVSMPTTPMDEPCPLEVGLQGTESPSAWRPSLAARRRSSASRGRHSPSPNKNWQGSGYEALLPWKMDNYTTAAAAHQGACSNPKDRPEGFVPAAMTRPTARPRRRASAITMSVCAPLPQNFATPRALQRRQSEMSVEMRRESVAEKVQIEHALSTTPKVDMVRYRQIASPVKSHWSPDLSGAEEGEGVSEEVVLMVEGARRKAPRAEVESEGDVSPLRSTFPIHFDSSFGRSLGLQDAAAESTIPIFLRGSAKSSRTSSFYGDLPNPSISECQSASSSSSSSSRRSRHASFHGDSAERRRIDRPDSKDTDRESSEQRETGGDVVRLVTMLQTSHLDETRRLNDLITSLTRKVATLEHELSRTVIDTGRAWHCPCSPSMRCPSTETGLTYGTHARETWHGGPPSSILARRGIEVCQDRRASQSNLPRSVQFF